MANQPNFEAFIASERARITEEREALTKQARELDAQIDALNRELEAINAYEGVKSGRTIVRTPFSETKAPRSSGEGTGTRRTGQREAVLNLIKNRPDGIPPADILTEMDATSEADKTSVRNALSALKRTHQVGNKGGRYFPA